MCVCLHPLFTADICERQSSCPLLLAVICHTPTPVTGHWPWLRMESLLHLQKPQIIPKQPEEVVQAQCLGPGPRTPGLSRAVVIYVRSSRARTLCSALRVDVTRKASQATEGCVLTLSILTAGQEGAGWDGMAPWEPWHMEGWASFHLLLLTHLWSCRNISRVPSLAMSDGALLAWGMWAHTLLNQGGVGQRNPSEK